jgi:hypothetical protein
MRDADWLITNPPFGTKTVRFVLRALELARVGVAMFVRLQWLETVERYELLFRIGRRRWSRSSSSASLCARDDGSPTATRRPPIAGSPGSKARRRGRRSGFHRAVASS